MLAHLCKAIQVDQKLLLAGFRVVMLLFKSKIYSILKAKSMRSLGYLKDKFQSLSLPKKLALSLLIVFLIGVAAYAGYLFGFQKTTGSDEAKSPTGTVISGKPQEPTNFPNPITGVLFKKSEAQSWVNQLAIGVIIENSSDARPQSGLSKADAVYEALAEGGITRTLAIFLQEDATVGPVRSNRPYFIDWLSEYDAAYAHVGGSPEGQARVQAYGIKDLDQFYIGAPTYERITSRAAPHNVYTTITKLRQAATNKGYKKDADITPWKFTDAETPVAQRPAAFSLKVGFLGIGAYSVEWRYNPTTNTYFRFNGGVAHIDALTNSQLEFKTIVLQVVNKSFDPSGHGRLFMDTIGTGPAKVFLNGSVVEGTWKKDNRGGRTKFFDATGQEIKFNRGKIWVEVVPPESVNTY